MAKKFIAIEGNPNDDANFVRALFKSMKIDYTNFKFESLGGEGEFEKKLKELVKNLQKGDTLAFIRDAENKKPIDHLKSLQKQLKEWLPESKLKAFNIIVPNKLSQFEDGETKIGIYVLPSEGESGSLEDLCLKLFIKEPLSECVESFFACIQKDNKIKKHLSKKKSLLQLALFCCSQEKDFVYNAGSAAQKDYLNLKQNDIPELNNLKTFLKEFAK